MTSFFAAHYRSSRNRSADREFGKIWKPLNFRVFLAFLALFVCISPVFGQNYGAKEPLNLLELIKWRGSDWLSFHPIYQDTFLLASETGGQNKEYRDQDRAANVNRVGADGTIKLDRLILGVRVSFLRSLDYHYYNAREDRTDTYFGPSETYLRFGFATGSAFPPSAVSSEDPEAKDGIFVRAGRLYFQDPYGFLFTGEANGGRLDVVGLLPFLKRFSLVGFETGRERSTNAHRNSFYGGAEFHVSWGSGDLSGSGGFYRSPGQAEKPDLILPGILNTTVTVPTGQPGLPDRDVHYYSIAFRQEFSPLEVRSAVYGNGGREMPVSADGTRILSGRKSIRGGAAYLGMIYRAGKGQESPGCNITNPARRFCVQPYSLKDGPEIEAAVIYTSRDRDAADDDLQGYGSIRPAPTLAGGMASIFMSGSSPDFSRLPLRNFQPGQPVFDGGLPDRRNQIDRTDRTDPAPPDYGNRGMTMGSLRFTTAFKSGLLRLDAFINYADFLKQDGWEGILAGRFWFERSWVQFFLQATLSTATLRQSEWTTNPYGLLERPARNYYSRYTFSFGLLL